MNEFKYTGTSETGILLQGQFVSKFLLPKFPGKRLFRKSSYVGFATQFFEKRKCKLPEKGIDETPGFKDSALGYNWLLQLAANHLFAGRSIYFKRIFCGNGQ